MSEDLKQLRRKSGGEGRGEKERECARSVAGAEREPGVEKAF